MNVEQYRQMKSIGKSKYRNKKTGKYDSKKESERAGQLKLMEQQGLISNLKEQVPFMLIPAQYEEIMVQLKTKVKPKKVCVEKSCSYYADFTYNDNENNKELVVEDTKGVKTEAYRIKKKLMYQVYGIKIKET